MNDQLERDLAGLMVEAPELAVNAAIAVSASSDGYVTRHSPVGTLYVAFGREGVTHIDVAESPAQFEARFAASTGREALPVRTAPERIERHLDRAIAEGRPGPLPVDLEALTEFQQAVLAKTAEIPPGEVRPYGWIAREIGKPGAVRAVGSALAKNPVPVVIPCHRVVRSDGHLGNYSLGTPENKRTLLEAEGLDLDGYEQLAGRGVRFIGSDTTNIFCHPTCKPAMRISDPHRVEFHSESEAVAAGFRPCKVCRPAVTAA